MIPTMDLRAHAEGWDSYDWSVFLWKQRCKSIKIEALRNGENPNDVILPSKPTYYIFCDYYE